MSRRPLAIPSVLLIAGCLSSPPATNDPGAGTHPGRHTSIAAAPAGPPDAVDVTRPLFVTAQPGARCTLHPAGAAPAEDDVVADRAGRVRFFAPPQSWGSALELDCTAGSTTQHISVDLDDPSTYQIDTDLVQRAATTSIRPPLTGDLQSIPTNEILRRGFPPRPDVTRDPARYQQWTDLVSKPHVVRDVTFVVAPGRHAGPYAGSFNDIEDPGSGGPAWGGRAYDSAGWHALSGDPDIAIAPNENLNWYLEYDTQMYLPSTSCSPGGCQAFQWAGMGGMEALDGKTNGTLIQSGVHLQNSSAPVPFVEYYPSPPSYPAGYALNAGDAIEFWGWLATSNACADNDTGRTAMVACFGFYDWSSSEFIPTIAVTIPSGKTYYGYTFESIIEKIPNVNFINFSSVQFSDTANDQSGGYHNAASDAWIFLDAVSESRHPLTTSHNPDGTTNDEQWYQTDWDMNYF